MACPVCNSNKFKKLFFMKEVSRITKKSYPLFKCKKCGLIRPHPLPYSEQSKLSIYDSDKNIKFYNARTGKIDFDSREYQDYFKHFRQYQDFVKKYKTKGRHLDIGCGAGHIIRLLSDLGLASEGLEISPKLVKALKQKYKVHCLELQELHGKYNLITMSHVLEHLVSPDKFVKEINKHLLPEGFVIISVPYLRGIIPRILRTYWYGIGHGQHLNLFSKESLRILFENNGFRIIEFKTSILDYTHPKFPRIINLFSLFLSRIIEYLNLGDNLYMVAVKSEEK